MVQKEITKKGYLREKKRPCSNIILFGVPINIVLKAIQHIYKKHCILVMAIFVIVKL